MTVSVPAWLADDGLRPLWDAARARLERNYLTPSGRVVLSDLSRKERHAIGGLLGRTVVSERVAVDLAQLDSILAQRSPYAGLADTITTVTGEPVRDRRAERSADAAAREAPFVLARELVKAEPVLAGATWVEEWLAGVRRSGLLTRSTDPGAAVRSAVAVLAALRSVGRTSRTDLAAGVAGDAHALDDGTVLAQLVLRAVAAELGADPPSDTAARRDLWERVGVVADSVSSTCLVLGVAAHGEAPAARRLRLAADAGEPVHVTPRDLRGLTFGRHGDVLVCENPRVLEAAAERFGGAVPVVCTAGQPALVVVDVLRRLSDAGAVLHYHGDFDWPGIAIANRLAAEVRAVPWLMDAADYLAAVRRAPAAVELAGAPVAAAWDPELAPAMEAHGVAVHEEAVVTEILTAATSFKSPRHG